MAQQKAVEKPVEDLDDLVDELEPGTKLLKGQYTITRYLNSGGFGITYIAKDSLDRDVVIKECFPAAFSRRSKTLVAARSRAHTAELRSVVQLFVKEARSLSKIVHPNIVAVHQVFEDNGTAYMAIDYVDGLDLQQIIDGQGGTIPTPAEIVVIAEKLLHAVGFIHANDMLHRDISPDNVLISKAGEPVLIDFGAAREQASKSNRAMSALRVVKDGYSPQEFYIAGSDQGPWSDLYALGATFYHLISGEAPLNGQARLAALAEDRPDPYDKLDGRIPGYPPGFLAAIDKALSTLPKQRVQSATDWLAMFTNSAGLSPATGRILRSTEPVETAVHDLILAESAASEARKTAETGFGAPPAFARQVSQRPANAAPTKSGVGTVQVVAGIAATLAVLGVGIMMLGGDTASPPAAPATEAALPTTNAPVETAAVSQPATPAAPAASADPTIQPTTVEATIPAPETAAGATAAPAPAAAPEPETVVAAAIPEAAPATAEPDPAAEASAQPIPAPDPAAAPEAALPATETAEVAAPLLAPTGTLRPNQVNFAAWDIELPFIEGSRIVDSQRVAIVQSVVPGTDLSQAGTWIEPGVRVLSVNGTDVQQAGSVATSVLNAMTVDPDGRARVVVEYASQTAGRQTGLLTVSANRLVSLGNGVNFAVQTVDGRWRTVVTGVTLPEATDLRQGDILYREKSTGLALEASQSLETIMATLVEEGTSLTEFSILRDSRIDTAAMQLATD